MKKVRLKKSGEVFNDIRSLVGMHCGHKMHGDCSNCVLSETVNDNLLCSRTNIKRYPEEVLRLLGAEEFEDNVQADKDGAKIHKELCDEMHEVYLQKNHDYGNSFAILRARFPKAILIRLYDKYQRLETLINGETPEVAESIDDTLLDLANYCLLELTERRKDGNND